MYTAAPGALAAIAIGAAPPPRLARVAGAAHSLARSAARAGRSAWSLGAAVDGSGAGQGWGAGRRNGRAVYLERRSQRPRGFLFLTAHTSFINRNKFRLIDSPSLVSGAGL